MSEANVSTNDHLLAVGKLVHIASVVEIFMFSAFVVLSGCSPRVARAIFYTLDSLPARKQLLLRTCAVAGDDETRKLVETIIHAAQKASNQRREVAHALIATMDEDGKLPLVIMNPKSATEPKPVSPAWLKLLGAQSTDALQEGLVAWQQFCRHRGVDPKIDLG